MYILGSVSLVFSLDTLQQHQPTQFWLFPFFFFGWPHPAAAVSLDYSTAGLIRFPSVFLYSTVRVELFRLSSCVGYTLFESREYIAEINIYTDSRLNVCTCYFRWCHLGCWISWRVLMGMMRKIERIKTSDLWYGGEIRGKNRQGNWAIHVFLFFFGRRKLPTLNNNGLRLCVCVYNEREL